MEPPAGDGGDAHVDTVTTTDTSEIGVKRDDTAPLEDSILCMDDLVVPPVSDTTILPTPPPDDVVFETAQVETVVQPGNVLQLSQSMISMQQVTNTAVQWFTASRNMTMSAIGAFTRAVKMMVPQQTVQPDVQPPPSPPAATPSLLPSRPSMDRLAAYPTLKLNRPPTALSRAMCIFVINTYLRNTSAGTSTPPHCVDISAGVEYDVTSDIVMNMMKESTIVKSNIPLLFQACCVYCGEHFDGMQHGDGYDV